MVVWSLLPLYDFKTVWQSVHSCPYTIHNCATTGYDCSATKSAVCKCYSSQAYVETDIMKCLTVIIQVLHSLAVEMYGVGL